MSADQIRFDRYLPFALVAAANAISGGASREYLRRFGVGVTEWRVLANLKARPGMTANAIASLSRLDKGGVSRAIAALADAGYLEIGPPGDDRRKRALFLTERGNALHEEMIGVALARERQLLADFSEDERTALFALLARVLANATALDDG